MTGNTDGSYSCQGVVTPDGTMMVPQWTSAGDQIMVPAGDHMMIVAWPVEQEASCGGAWMVSPHSMAGPLQDMPQHQLQHQMPVSAMTHMQPQTLHQSYHPAQPQQMMHNSVTPPFAGHANTSCNSGPCCLEGPSWQLQVTEPQACKDTATHGKVFVHNSDGALKPLPNGNLDNFGSSRGRSPSPEATEDGLADAKIGGKIFVHSADGALHHVAQCSSAGELVEVDEMEEEKSGQGGKKVEEKEEDVFGDFFREHWRLDEEETWEDSWRYEPATDKRPPISLRSREQRMEELRALQAEQREHLEKQRQRQRRMEDLLQVQREEAQLRRAAETQSIPKLRVLQRNKDELHNYNQDRKPSLELSGLDASGQSRQVSRSAGVRGTSPGSSRGSSSAGSTTASTGDLVPPVPPPATSSALGAIGDRIHRQAQARPRASRQTSKEAAASSRDGVQGLLEEPRAVAGLILWQAYSRAAPPEPSPPSSSAPSRALKAAPAPKAANAASKRNKKASNQASSSRPAAKPHKPAPPPPPKKPERRKQPRRTSGPGFSFSDVLALPGVCWNQARSFASAVKRSLTGAAEVVAALLQVAVKATPGGAPALVVAAILALVAAFLAAIPSDDRGLTASGRHGHGYGYYYGPGYGYGQSYSGYRQAYSQSNARSYGYGQPYDQSYGQPSQSGYSSSDRSWPGYSADEVFRMSEAELTVLRQRMRHQGYDIPLSWSETQASAKARSKNGKPASDAEYAEATRQYFESLQNYFGAEQKGLKGGTSSKASTRKKTPREEAKLQKLLKRYNLPEHLLHTMDRDELVEGLEFMNHMGSVASAYFGDSSEL